jgi:uncharacterized SAM-binding protein YcdF (DUF218 family)
MRTIITTLIACCCLFFAKAQTNTAIQSYQLITGKNQPYHQFIQYKSYYLLTLMQELPELRKAIATDKIFDDLLKAKIENAKTSLKNNSQDINYMANAMKFSDEEIKKISDRFLDIYTNENVFGKVIVNHILPSGCYGLYANLTPKEILVKAWEQDVKAINYTIDVYFAGKKPNYPKIDSISFSIKDRQFPELVASSMNLNITAKNQLFFEPTMHFAQSALELNGRTEAADHEPLANGMNKNAIAQIKKTNFSNYKYSVILVPGAGPEEPETEISAASMIRCRIAAIQYKNGVAPFIVVSGGRVHPYKTKYSEAFEMKKFMVNILRIPENAIIMEPHARHTTTNFRNCARLMYRYGMPMQKPAIVSTTKSTIPYITATLLERCKKELGYYPYKNGKIISDNEAEFYPSSLSLQIDFDEPLDP